MRKIGLFMKILLISCSLLVLSGCWGRHELNSLAIVSGIGLDKADGNHVRMTIEIFKPVNGKSDPKDQSGGGSENYTNVTDTGANELDILRGLSHVVNKELYFPHNHVIVLGRELAEGGLQKHIDFFVRNQEARLNVWVLLSESKASEILDVPPLLGNMPAEEISRLVELQGENSQSCQVNLEQFISSLMSRTTSPILPIIEISGAGQQKKLRLAGTAVFKGDKYAGELNSQETRGLLWIRNEIRNGIIEIEGPDGEKATLEITHSSTKIIPAIADGKLQFKIEIRVEGDLGSQSGQESMATPTGFEDLEKRTAAVIENEINAALEKAQELNADIFGFGEEIHRKEPGEWKKISSDWENIFPQLDLSLNIKTQLNFPGRITRPVEIPQKEQ